jgi:hypothetical protein
MMATPWHVEEKKPALMGSMSSRASSTIESAGEGDRYGLVMRAV